jgi:hypothetical protein
MEVKIFFKNGADIVLICDNVKNYDYNITLIKNNTLIARFFTNMIAGYRITEN